MFGVEMSETQNDAIMDEISSGAWALLSCPFTRQALPATLANGISRQHTDKYLGTLRITETLVRPKRQAYYGRPLVHS